jgi:hypothetical protein
LSKIVARIAPGLSQALKQVQSTTGLASILGCPLKQVLCGESGMIDLPGEIVKHPGGTFFRDASDHGFPAQTGPLPGIPRRDAA